MAHSDVACAFVASAVTAAAPAQTQPAVDFSACFAGTDTHAVFVPLQDAVIVGDVPVTKQLVDVYQEHQMGVVGLFEVAREAISMYGVIRGEKISDKTYRVFESIEKPRPEEAPSNLAATLTAENQVLLDWSDNSGNESVFRIERRQDGDFALVTTAPADADSFVDATAQPEAAYGYRVRAQNGAGASEYSNEAEILTPGRSVDGAWNRDF